MVGILKKGVDNPACFRRSLSANSVHISDEVQVISASSECDTSHAEQPSTLCEPVPLLQTNSVKMEEEFPPVQKVDPPQLEAANVPNEVDTSPQVESAEQLPQNHALVLQRSVSDTGPESGSGPVSTSPITVEGEDVSHTSSPFPSLPDTVLKTMGLLVNGSVDRESLTEDDIENRFTSLSLAFRTDQLTLSTRLELQKRQRDQAECNMSVEATRLKTAIHKLNRVYVDAESIENLTQIQTLVDILQQATDRVSSSAEMFGAVQQEQRLSLATEVLMSHVENVKRSLEKMHIELEELKRVLAENNIVLEEIPDLIDEPAPRTHRYRSLAGIMTANKKIGSKRRASIAAMPRPLGNSTESPRTLASPAVPCLEQRSRMANVVNAIRRKTSLSPVPSQSTPGLESRDWLEQATDTMEEIEEVPEAQGIISPEDRSTPSTAEENISSSDINSSAMSLENRDMVPVYEASTTEDKEELVVVKSEPLPNTFQTILKEMKRQLIEARSQITDLYQNHRSTILEKLRLYVAAILLGLAASFLIWMMFPSVDAWHRVQTNTLENSMKPGYDKTPPS